MKVGDKIYIRAAKYHPFEDYEPGVIYNIMNHQSCIVFLVYAERNTNLIQLVLKRDVVARKEYQYG